MMYRCPVCFSRENDVVLFKKDENNLYCIKCSFNGTIAEVEEMYADMKKKYHFIKKRILLDEMRKL